MTVGGRRVGAVGVTAELGPETVEWAVVNVFVADAPSPRAMLLDRMARAMELRCESSVEEVLTQYRDRCSTLGRNVRARMIPLGPNGPQVTGRAVDCLHDGALVVETASGRRVAVRPQHLALLDVVSPEV